MSRNRAVAGASRSWGVSELSAFYIEHRSDLVKRANRLLRDSHKAEEVVQDALVNFILAAPELEGTNHALSYLLKTVDNLCMDVFRQEGRRPNLVVLDSISNEREVSLQDHRDHSDVISEADDAAIVRQALSLLSPAERAALVMWEIEGRSTKEIARELGVKDSTVRHTVSRARASMRKILSEYVIDADRNLTALDLLSNSYRRAVKLAKDGSRVALSVVALILAYLGFGSFAHDLAPSNLPDTSSEVSTSNQSEAPQLILGSRNIGSFSNPGLSTSKVASKNVSRDDVSNAKASPLSFFGLDKNGIPTGFTVADSSGKSGQLYFSGKDAVVGEEGVTLTAVAKTMSGAANIFLNQTIYQDLNGLAFDAIVSFGRQGTWTPLNATVVSSDIERLVSGNYLFTATLQVKSELDTALVIPAYAGGRDLEVAPARIVVRVLMNPSKTQVVGEAVYVVERVSK